MQAALTQACYQQDPGGGHRSWGTDIWQPDILTTG